MAFVLLASFASVALTQSPTETLPIIINQGPTARCYGWYAEPTSNGHPPTTETSCAGANMYGRFTLADYGWKYPSEYNTSPGFAGSVSGANGSPLLVSLSNNAKNADCNRALEVNLSFDYPNSALYPNISSTDLAQYDSIIVEYDVFIRSATTAKSDCVCTNGDGPCPSWWKSQLTTDLLFYQGSGSEQDFNAISVRHFDPQNYGTFTFSTSGGYRVQYTDNQIPSQSGARAHVKLDAKYLIQKYSNELCQGGGLRGPIYFRSIQIVLINTGTDSTVEISNVKANAFKYAPGQFTPTSVSPGPTATNCPAGGSPSSSSTPPPTSSTVPIYGQCGGSGWTGPTTCATGTTCQSQDSYYSQCLPSGGSTSNNPPASTTTSSACSPTTKKYAQCGGQGFGCDTSCPPGTSCVAQNQYYSQCL